MKNIYRSLGMGFVSFAVLIFTGTVRLPAQTPDFSFQTFDGNIRGMTPRTVGMGVVYAPGLNATGNGGGSCRVSVDYSQSAVFQLFVADGSACGSGPTTLLAANNFSAVEFDVMWDNSSTVPLSVFNSTPGGDDGLVIKGQSSLGPLCASNAIIPSAAINGWVHVVVPIAPGATGTFTSLLFTKPFAGYGSGTTAAFWLDNIKLTGHGSHPVEVTGHCSTEGMELRWNGEATCSYSVLKSTDLVNWTIVVSHYPAGGATNGPVRYLDAPSDGSPCFYRLRCP